MSHLIPEVRVNKNGVAVTKHVRPISHGSSSAAIPSPTLQRSPDVVQKENRIKSVLSEVSVHKGIARKRMEEALWNMEPDEFERIETLSKGNGEVDSWKHSHRQFVKDIIDDPEKKNRTLYLNAAEAFDDDYQDWSDTRALRGLRNIPEFAPYAEDMRTAPPEVMEAAHRIGEYRNVFGGQSFLFHNTQTRWRLRSRELEDIVINDPARSNMLLEWAETHSDTDISDLDGKLALRVIRKPEEGDAIADLLDRRLGDTDLVELILDRPESHKQIFELYERGITKAIAIQEVLDGKVKLSLSSGVL